MIGLGILALIGFICILKEYEKRCNKSDKKSNLVMYGCGFITNKVIDTNSCIKLEV